MSSSTLLWRNQASSWGRTCSSGFTRRSTSAISSRPWGVVMISLISPGASEKAAWATGEVSDIIRTPYGFELIQLVERRVKPLEVVRSLLEAELRRNQLEAAIQELIQRYPVEVDTQYFQAPPQTPHQHP